jgi:hypothetical protein
MVVGLGTGMVAVRVFIGESKLSVRVEDRYSSHVTDRVMLLQRLRLWIFSAAESVGCRRMEGRGSAW